MRILVIILSVCLFLVISGCKKDDQHTTNVAPHPTPNTFRIYKTNDGGLTWGNALDIEGSRFPLEISFSAPNTYFIITSDNQLFRSTNGGSVWQSIDLPANAGILTSVSSGGRTSFCSIVNTSGVIMLSKDNGDTWTEPESPVNTRLNSIHISPEPYTCGFIAGISGTVFATNDAGETWNQLPLTAQTELFDIDYFGCGSTIIASANNKVYLSNDYGASWSATNINPSSSGPDITSVSIDENGQDAVGLCSGGGIIYSHDLGQSWQTATPAPYTGNIVFHNLDNTSETIFAVGDAGTIWNSIDHGYSWHNIPNNSVYSLMDICFKDDSDGIIIAKPN